MPTWMPAREVDGMYTIAVTDKKGRVLGTMVGSESGLYGLSDAYALQTPAGQHFIMAADAAGVPVIMTDDVMELAGMGEGPPADFVLVTDEYDVELAGIFDSIKRAVASAAGRVKEAVQSARLRFTLPTEGGGTVAVTPSTVRQAAGSVGVQVTSAPPAGATTVERMAAQQAAAAGAGMLGKLKALPMPAKIGLAAAAFFLLKGKL
jgi:hypothetical protein